MKFEKFGKYTLLKKIAMGGMAEIFLARTANVAGVSQFVVVKRILPQFSSNKNFLEMFKNEGRITAHLRHSNLVYIYEFGEYQGDYYIAMEYVSGCSLKDFSKEVLKKHSKFPLACAAYIIQSIASSLHYIHNCINPETGLPLYAIHRDISPHNIMIGFNGDIKLIDFGIAKVSDSNLTSSGVVKGKFSYMSPEQVKGRKLDHRTDVFSLGTVLWELIFGKKLFGGSNVHAVIGKVRECRVPNISQIRADVPQAIHKILKMSICKELNSRYQSAEDMERDLNLFLNDKYKSFSHFDFNNFVKNLYADKILKERQNIVQLSKKLKEIKGSLQDEQNALKKNSFSIFGKKKNSKKGFKETEPFGSAGSLIKPKLPFDQGRSSAFKDITDHPAKIKNNPLSKKLNKKTVISSKAPLSHAPTRVVKQKKRSSSELKLCTNEQPSIFETKRSKGTYYHNIQKNYGVKVKRYKKTQNLMQIGILMICVCAGLWAFQKLSGGGGGDDSFLNPSQSTNEAVKTMDAYIPKEIPNLAQNKPEPQPRSAFNSSEVQGSGRKPASVRSAKVFIETIPSGGKIFLNGRQISERTPTVIAISRDRRNQLRIVKEGYENYVLNNFSSTAHLQIRLKRKPLSEY